jgi:hypothetical protein
MMKADFVVAAATTHNPQSVSPAPTGKAESKFKNLKLKRGSRFLVLDFRFEISPT